MVVSVSPSSRGRRHRFGACLGRRLAGLAVTLLSSEPLEGFLQLAAARVRTGPIGRDDLGSVPG